MIFLRQLPVVLVIVFILSPDAAGMEAQSGTNSAWPTALTNVLAATSGPGLEAWIQLLGMLLLLLGILILQVQLQEYNLNKIQET